jgi:hypothetical protein
MNSKTIFSAFIIVSIFTINSFAQHSVHLKSGVTINGYVTGIAGGVLSLDADGKMMTYKVDELKSIDFNAATAASASESGVMEQKFTSTDGLYVVKYKMKGRTVAKGCKIVIGTQDKGTVVVDVIIDKYGNVIKATPGAPGSSTTNDDYLFTKAQKFAQEIKFDSVPTAPLETKGTVTFTF